MNTDFRLSTTFFEHPKIVKLQRRLGDVGVLCHIRLFRFTSVNKPDGILRGMDAEEIAIASGFTGDPTEYVSTLLELRLLDQDEEEADAIGQLRVHDWDEWNPWAAGAGERSQIAKEAANARWEEVRRRKEAEEAKAKDAKKQGASKQGASKGKKGENAPVPMPAAASPNAAHQSAMPLSTAADAPAMPVDAEGNALVCSEQCAAHQSAMPLSYPILSDSFPTPLLSDSYPSPNLPTPNQPLDAGELPPATFRDRLEGEELDVCVLLEEFLEPEEAAQQVYLHKADKCRWQLDALKWRLSQPPELRPPIPHPGPYLLKCLTEDVALPQVISARKMAAHQTKRDARRQRQAEAEQERGEMVSALHDQAEHRWQSLAPEEQSCLEQEAQAEFCRQYPDWATACREGRLGTGRKNVLRNIRDAFVLTNRVHPNGATQ